MRVADLRHFDIPFMFTVAALSDPWEREEYVFNVFEHLPAVTFGVHDPDRFECMCRNPLRPYKGCPSHRGRAMFMERAGFESEGWRR